MKRNSQSISHSSSNQELITQIAFHEAGHAAGIYLYNKQNCLPSLFFQINQNIVAVEHAFTMRRDAFITHVEGGYLIDNLPIDLLESASYYSDYDLDSYQASFEADMVNLLVGALAEAKHVALRENRHFSHHHHVDTLQFFGGSSDLDKVYEYLERFVADAKMREELFIDLLSKALTFINTPKHWQAIERLAALILTSPQQTINCEQAIAVLDG